VSFYYISFFDWSNKPSPFNLPWTDKVPSKSVNTSTLMLLIIVILFQEKVGDKGKRGNVLNNTFPAFL
jgi:hypothetical protein